MVTINWTKDLNIHHKLEKHFLNILSETLKALKENQIIVKKSLTPKIWFYLPRTYKTLIIVGQLSDYQKMESQIDLNPQTDRKPKCLASNFDNLKIQQGSGFVFKEIQFNQQQEFETIKLGEIWTIE